MCSRNSPTEKTVRRGRCLCGAVRFEVDGPPRWALWCHCRSCRLATGAPVTAWFGVRHGMWRWTGERPRARASSPGAERSCCAACGTPLSFTHERWPDEIHFHTALLDDPTGFEPTGHVHFAERLAFVDPKDGLPRWAGLYEG